MAAVPVNAILGFKKESRLYVCLGGRASANAECHSLVDISAAWKGLYVPTSI